MIISRMVWRILVLYYLAILVASANEIPSFGGVAEVIIFVISTVITVFYELGEIQKGK